LVMAGTSILWADHRTIWALHHRARPSADDLEELVPFLVGDVHHCPRCAMAPLCGTGRSKWRKRPLSVAGHGTD